MTKRFGSIARVVGLTLPLLGFAGAALAVGAGEGSSVGPQNGACECPCNTNSNPSGALGKGRDSQPSPADADHATEKQDQRLLKQQRRHEVDPGNSGP